MIELLFGKVIVGVQIWFVAAVTVLGYVDKTGTVVACMGAVLLHECGHLAAMLCVGAPPRRITFGLSGICIEHSDRAVLAPCQAIILLMGPLFNLATAACTWFAHSAFWYIHLAMGLLQLLPIEPLDGGQLLLLFLSTFCHRAQAERISLVISAVFLTALACLGIYALIDNGHNVTFLFGVLYLCIQMRKSRA